MDTLDKVLQDIREWCDKEGLGWARFVTVDAYAIVLPHEYRPKKSSLGARRWWSPSCGVVYGVKNRNLVKRLLSVCDDNWKKCCYELPKSKPKYEDEETTQKLKNQLEAQFKIIDIIQQTQAEIEPDWVADWEDGNQEKAYLVLGFGYLENEAGLECSSDFSVRMLPDQMYSSPEVMKHIVENDLVSAKLLKQWQTGKKI